MASANPKIALLVVVADHRARVPASSEIFTLGILNFKLYTSVSTRLLPAIQRQSKSLSFRPMIQHVARRWGDASDETNEAFGGPLVEVFSHAMRISLAPGPSLDKQNKRMAERALLDIDALVSSSDSKTNESKIMLLDWARHVITQASSCGVYGNEHPFRDPEVEQAFW